MSHLIPFIAIAVVATVVSDRGLAGLRAGARATLAAVRGLGDYVLALWRWYARLALGA